MNTSIDSAGRIVTPKALRDRVGLVPGIELHIVVDGTGIRIEPAPGAGLARKGRFLTIPCSGDPISDAMVNDLRRNGQR